MRVVVGDEGVHDHRGADRHERGDEVEGADAALDQPARRAARAGDRRRRGVRGHDERREEREGAEGGHDLLAIPARPHRSRATNHVAPGPQRWQETESGM